MQPHVTLPVFTNNMRRLRFTLKNNWQENHSEDWHVTEKLEYQHRDLIEKCKLGNRKAQFELYNLYVSAMYNTCLRIVKQTADAEDIIQDSFVKAFANLNRFEYRSTFGAWLKRIVINQTLSFLNKNKLPICEFEDARVEMIEEENEEAPTFDWNIDIIKKSIQLLSDGYRQILSLYLLEGYDHDEISQIAGISVSTSKSQYHRAKKRLVEIIKNQPWTT